MKKVLAILLALAMMLSLVACSGFDDNDGNSPSTPSTQPNADGEVVLRVGTSDNMGSFLIGGNQGSNYRALYLVFDSLFYFDDEGEPYSTVLEDWYYEDDCTFVMKLKDGIMFSNGDQMVGEDILFSLFNYSERDSAWAALFSAFNQETSYVEDDNLTVVLKTDEPYGPGVFGCGNIPIYNKSWNDEVGYDSELWLTNPVGSGPHTCVEYVTDSHCILEKRDDYWDSSYSNEIDRYIINYYKEDSTMYIDLETGALDIACNISNSDYARGVSGTDNVAVEALSCGDVIFLSLDVDDNEYLADPKVREAIAYGVNWIEVGQASRGDMAKAATSIIAESSQYHYDCGAYEYDPERAAQALAESSFAGEDISLYLVNLNEEVKIEMATVLQYYLGQLGITLTFEDFDFPNALVQWLEVGGTDVSFQDSDTGSIIGEPYVSLRFLMEGSGPFPVCTIGDERFNELAQSALYTIDEDERYEYYKQLQEYAYENYLVIPIFYAVDAIAWRTKVYPMSRTFFQSSTVK